MVESVEMAGKGNHDPVPSPEERIAYLEGRIKDHTEAVAELRGDVRGLRVEVHDLREHMNRGFEAVDGRFVALDQKLDRLFLRVDAKTDGVGTGLNARIDGVETRFDAKLDEMGGRLGARIDEMGRTLNARIDGVEIRFDAKLDEMGGRLGARIDEMGRTLNARIDGVEIRLDAKISRHFTWLVGLQVTALVAIVGALLGR
jgi:hypothetical protein